MGAFEYSPYALNLPLIMLGLVTVMRGPFLTFPLGQVPVDGQGLNPLLQDPWMTIHPPVLFTGFSSLVAPFAIAIRSGRAPSGAGLPFRPRPSGSCIHGRA